MMRRAGLILNRHWIWKETMKGEKNVYTTR